MKNDSIRMKGVSNRCGSMLSFYRYAESKQRSNGINIQKGYESCLYIHYINSTVFPSHRIIKIVIKRDEKYSPRLVIFVAERKRGRSDKGMER